MRPVNPQPPLDRRRFLPDVWIHVVTTERRERRAILHDEAEVELRFVPRDARVTFVSDRFCEMIGDVRARQGDIDLDDIYGD